jgi:Flp pilus assembly protein TadB
MRTLVAALLTGITAASITVLVAPPTRRLGPRLAPYAQRARALIGHNADASVVVPPPQPAVTGVFGPIAAAGAQRLSGLLDRGGDDEIAHRLRQAGRRDLTPDQYRSRQLAGAVRGLVIFVAVGLVAAPSGPTVVLAAVLGVIWGTSRWRTGIDRAIARRREQMRAELYTTAQILAIDIRANVAPLVAVDHLVARGGGAVTDELGDAIDWIGDGATARDAFERLAHATPEPAAARLYRLLATSDVGAGETLAGALRHTANDLRAQRREDSSASPCAAGSRC